MVLVGKGIGPEEGTREWATPPVTRQREHEQPSHGNKNRKVLENLNFLEWIMSQRCILIENSIKFSIFSYSL
jgi:hypothetical protein